MNIIGIYKIINLEDNKMYVGSSFNLKDRECTHFSRLKNDNHCNKHLQNAYNRDGKNNFKFVMLEELEEDTKLEFLLEREQYWIDTLKSSNTKYGYNKRIVASSNIGIRHSWETKEILSNYAKKQMTKQYREIISNRYKGLDPLRNFTEKEKKNIYCKISKILKGRKFTIEWKKKLSNSHKGKKLNEIHKQKLILANKGNTYRLGKKHSKETKNKISHSNKGKKHSEETKNKISSRHSKKVVNLDTGEIFSNLRSAASSCGLKNKTSIFNSIHSTTKRAAKYRWAYYVESIKELAN